MVSTVNIYDMTDTWNDGAVVFNGIKMNVTNSASAAGSALLRLQYGGTDLFVVHRNADGGYSIGNATSGSNSGTIYHGANGNIDFRLQSPTGDPYVCMASNATTTGLQMGPTYAIGWRATGNGQNSVDTALFRDGVGVMSQRLGTTAQTNNLYGNYVDATDYHRLGVSVAKTTLASVSGATVTATSLIPDGAFLIGVTTKVTVALGGGGGTTGYQVGDGSDADRWGVASTITLGTTTDNVSATANPTGAFTAAQNVVITAVGGSFNGTGSIMVCAFYLIAQAD